MFFIILYYNCIGFRAAFGASLKNYVFNYYGFKAWKQKGEEYRIHGQWGWLWNSSTRKYKKHINAKACLLNGPAKIAVRVREGSIIKVLAVEPKTYDYLISNEGENKDVMEKRKSSAI